MTDVKPDFKARLDEERGRLREELTAMGVDLDGGGLEIDADEGFADSAATTAEKSERLALIEQLSVTLQLVEGALSRLDEGTYGQCERCGGKIPIERLDARPYAKLCMVCQERS